MVVGAAEDLLTDSVYFFLCEFGINVNNENENDGKEVLKVEERSNDIKLFTR